MALNKPLIIQDDLVVDNAPGRQLVIPYGGDAERPGAGDNPEPMVGTIRLNEDRGVVEIYNSDNEWQSVAQAGDAVNAEGAEEIALVQSIIFG
jgi:hypothetical protein